MATEIAADKWEEIDPTPKALIKIECPTCGVFYPCQPTVAADGTIDPWACPKQDCTFAPDGGAIKLVGWTP